MAGVFFAHTPILRYHENFLYFGIVGPVADPNLPAFLGRPKAPQTSDRWGKASHPPLADWRGT